jgi:RNA polymerase sigma factor (sigma-70 family)
VVSRQEEFATLIQKYARVMASAVRRVCSRRYRFLIPDVEQEIYVALWKRLESGKKIEHPASYLYKAALTTALMMVRKHIPDTLPIEMHEEGGSTPSENPFGGLLPAERARLLGEVLERLPPDQARAVRAHLAGFSHTEVASLYGWTESVARHRIYRAIETLRETMGGRPNERAESRQA